MSILRVRVNGTDTTASPRLLLGGPNLIEVEGDSITSATILRLPSIKLHNCAWYDSQQTYGTRKISRRFTCSRATNTPLGFASAGAVGVGVDDDGSMTVTIDQPYQVVGPFAVLDDIGVVI